MEKKIYSTPKVVVANTGIQSSILDGTQYSMKSYRKTYMGEINGWDVDTKSRNDFGEVTMGSSEMSLW